MNKPETTPPTYFHHLRYGTKLLALGATDVFNYKEDPDWGKAVFNRTGGVDKVVNAAGSGSLGGSFAALRPGGEVGTMGLLSFDAAPFDIISLMTKGLTARGIAVGNAEAFQDMVRTIDERGIKPPIDRRFRFEDAKSAYQAQLSQDLFGKVVISMV